MSPIDRDELGIGSAKAGDMEGNYVVKALDSLKDAINAYIEIKSANGEIALDAIWIEREVEGSFGKISKIAVKFSKHVETDYTSG